MNAAKLAVDRNGLSSRVEEPVDGHRVQQLALDPVDERGHERLLPRNPLQVTAVTEGVPGADIPECLPAVEEMVAGGQVESRLRVADPCGVALRYPADRIHHVLEAGEIDVHEMVDPDAGVGLDCLNGARGPQIGLVSVEVANRERFVDLE